MVRIPFPPPVTGSGILNRSQLQRHHMPPFQEGPRTSQSSTLTETIPETQDITQSPDVPQPSDMSEDYEVIIPCRTSGADARPYPRLVDPVTITLLRTSSVLTIWWYFWDSWDVGYQVCRGVLYNRLRSSVFSYVSHLHWGQWENLHLEFSRNTWIRFGRNSQNRRSSWP